MLNLAMPDEGKFVDIDDGNTLAHAIVDTVRDPLLVLDQDLRIVAASRVVLSDLPTRRVIMSVVI